MLGALLVLSAVIGYVRPKENRPGMGIYPEIAPFKAAPAVIRAGESATLSWASHGAESVILESIPEGGSAEEQRGLPPTGSITVRPRATTAYLLRCETVFSGRACEGTEATVEVKKAPLAPPVIESGFGGN